MSYLLSSFSCSYSTILKGVLNAHLISVHHCERRTAATMVHAITPAADKLPVGPRKFPRQVEGHGKHEGSRSGCNVPGPKGHQVDRGKTKKRHLRAASKIVKKYRPVWWMNRSFQREPERCLDDEHSGAQGKQTLDYCEGRSYRQHEVSAYVDVDTSTETIYYSLPPDSEPADHTETPTAIDRPVDKTRKPGIFHVLTNSSSGDDLNDSDICVKSTNQTAAVSPKSVIRHPQDRNPGSTPPNRPVSSQPPLGVSPPNSPVSSHSPQGVSPPNRPVSSHSPQGVSPPNRPVSSHSPQEVSPPNRPVSSHSPQGVSPPNRPVSCHSPQGVSPPNRPVSSYPPQGVYPPNRPVSSYPPQGVYPPDRPVSSYPPQGVYPPNIPVSSYPPQGIHPPNRPISSNPPQEVLVTAKRDWDCYIIEETRLEPCMPVLTPERPMPGLPEPEIECTITSVRSLAWSPPESVCSNCPSSCKYRYECHFCGIGFMDGALYAQHYGCHSHENPWTCTVCGITYQEKLSFNAHMIHSHAFWLRFS